MKTRLAGNHLLLLALVLAPGMAFAQEADQLSDVYDTLVVSESQGWGFLGKDVAAGPPDGRPPATLRIGETTYERGIGHHAPGALVFHLPVGEYTEFLAEVGVHWQGGGKGSVVFQVLVDGQPRFDSGRMSDSDSAKPVRVSLSGARELRLVSTDGGDGIGCDMANWANARLLRHPNALRFEPPALYLDGKTAPEPSNSVAGFALIANDTGPQVARLGQDAFAVCIDKDEVVSATVAVVNLGGSFSLEAEVEYLRGSGASLELSIEDGPRREVVLSQGRQRLSLAGAGVSGRTLIQIQARGNAGESLVQWRHLRLVTPGGIIPLRVLPRASGEEAFPSRVLPALRPAMEELLIEWDWRMQDGIGTERAGVSYATATERTLSGTLRLLEKLREDGLGTDAAAAQWQVLHGEYGRLAKSAHDGDAAWESLWRQAHRLRREIALSNPLADVGPLLFAKRVPASFSHQLTQYYGRYARPGGGLFILDDPGRSMQARELVASQLPQGAYMQPEVSYDSGRILFAFCAVPVSPTPKKYPSPLKHYFHLYEIRPDGTGLRQLTDGEHNDFSPRELPNGQIIFISTRRGGYHRCGGGPCEVYTLALAEADGSNPRIISYHETQEWDPAVLNDGRVVYTRWDYVDRNAVHYQQLWTTRPDGSAPMAYYGNNTLNPVGVWEARSVPGSDRVMATAAAHHAMTAGSIILLDTTKGIDGHAPLTRLTPDAPFPESETHVLPVNWHAPGSPKEYETPEAERRWPGHCYRSPYPLSEDFFLAAYSFDPLIGEPDANKANMFGIYLVDAFGNKELLYRDLNIASQWPVPIRPRTRPRILPNMVDPGLTEEGTFFLQDVYTSNVDLPRGTVKALRIVQVLPKTTPNANTPPVGLANASPGKQVLGTVPVEADGSAYFKAPARIPLSFQALDERGQAIHVMRSITYLQPGEQTSCVGCHEDRLSAPPRGAHAQALRRPPSTIAPAPEGALPLSYPRLVQPVLDRLCVDCHGETDPQGPEGEALVLTGAPAGQYTRSYLALAPRVPYSAWGSSLEENSEPAALPGRFGARASKLMQMLLEGHQDVTLEEEDIDRLVTWMDANALFYGTFDPDDQARQRRGERIEGPALE